MSITDKMRQLNPRVESKVAPIDKIQSILKHFRMMIKKLGVII